MGYEYKVMRFNGPTMTEYSTVEDVESTVNKMAQKGWRLVSTFTRDSFTTGVFGVFEKEITIGRRESPAPS
jgi:hypothetical protein